MYSFYICQKYTLNLLYFICNFYRVFLLSELGLVHINLELGLYCTTYAF